MTSAGSLSPEPGALLTGRPRVDLLNRLSVLQVGTSVSLAAAGAALHHLGARVAVAAGGASRVHGEDAARIIEVLDAGKERLHVPIADLAHHPLAADCRHHHHEPRRLEWREVGWEDEELRRFRSRGECARVGDVVSLRAFGSPKRPARQRADILGRWRLAELQPIRAPKGAAPH